MDEKLVREAGDYSQSHQGKRHPSHVYMRSLAQPRRLLIGVISLVLSVLIVAKYFGAIRPVFVDQIFSDGYTTKPGLSEEPQGSTPSKSNRSILVPLEAHIMSKCPDARDCLRDLVVPAMEKISDKVDFRLSFIGSYVPEFISFYMTPSSFSYPIHFWSCQIYWIFLTSV